MINLTLDMPIHLSVSIIVQKFVLWDEICSLCNTVHWRYFSTFLACDVIARFMRLSGREVFFLSGTDEHGQKVEQTAKTRGMEPQEFVDSVSVNFRDLLELLNISNDEFIRTTEEHHKNAVLVSRICAIVYLLSITTLFLNTSLSLLGIIRQNGGKRICISR